MIDQIADGFRCDLGGCTIGKSLRRLLLGSSVAVHIVVAVGVVEQANCLPFAFDPQLKHDGVAPHWTPLQVNQDSGISGESPNERIGHRRNVSPHSAFRLRSC